MASNDDFLTVLRSVAQNLGQMVLAMGAPGRTVSAGTSPIATISTTVGIGAIQIVAFNANRRGISFHSTDPFNNTTLYVSTMATVAAGKGIAIVPGQSMFISADLATNATWYVAAQGGASTNKFMVLEFV